MDSCCVLEEYSKRPKFGETSWQENTKSCLAWGAGGGGRGSQASPTEAKGAGGGGRSSTGERPKPKTLRAEKAGLPGERKVQVSRREAMKSRMWAAGGNLATS